MFHFSGCFRLIVLIWNEYKSGEKVTSPQLSLVLQDTQGKFSSVFLIETGIYRGTKSRHLRAPKQQQSLVKSQFPTWNWVAVALVWAQAKNRCLQETKAAAVW